MWTRHAHWMKLKGSPEACLPPHEMQDICRFACQSEEWGPEDCSASARPNEMDQGKCLAGTQWAVAFTYLNARHLREKAGRLEIKTLRPVLHWQWLTESPIKWRSRRHRIGAFRTKEGRNIGKYSVNLEAGPVKGLVALIGCLSFTAWR